RFGGVRRFGGAGRSGAACRATTATAAGRAAAATTTGGATPAPGTGDRADPGRDADGLGHLGPDQAQPGPGRGAGARVPARAAGAQTARLTALRGSDGAAGGRCGCSGGRSRARPATTPRSVSNLPVRLALDAECGAQPALCA